MNQGEFGLKDEQFWDDLASSEETLVDRYQETELMGLLLDGPSMALLDQCDSLPLVGVRASTIRDNHVLSLQRRAVVVAGRLDGHEVLAATAFRLPDEPRRRSPPRDPESLPKGRTVKAFTLSLTDRLEDFPWKEGAWRTTLLLYDQRSNSVTTHLTEPPRQDPVVRDFLAASRSVGYPLAIAPGLTTDGPNPYRARPDSPPAPAGAGIVLAVPRVAVLGPERHCLLRGSFRLPLLPRDVVRPLPGPSGSSAEAQALAEGWVEVGDRSALAIASITLLLTGDEKAQPILLPLHVPIYEPLDLEDGNQVGRGHFAIDLFEQFPDLAVQSYAVWAFSRQVVSDPVLLGVVAEAMLPAPGD